MIIAHLKTQNNQPYGSVRQCCERCGMMLWGKTPEGHDWTDDEEVYNNLPEEYRSCGSPTPDEGP